MTWWRRWCASCRTTWAPSAPPSPSSSSRPSGSGSATQSSYSQTRISTSRYMKVQGSNPASNDEHWYLLNLLCNIIKPIQWFSTIYLFSNVKTTMHSYRGSYWLPWLTIQYDTISSVGWCITILFPPSPTPPPPPPPLAQYPPLTALSRCSISRGILRKLPLEKRKLCVRTLYSVLLLHKNRDCVLGNCFSCSFGQLYRWYDKAYLFEKKLQKQPVMVRKTEFLFQYYLC